jgi:putative pyruvate formate lyase activating enzyme
MNPYGQCFLCGRNCGVDRTSGELGFCGETSELRISSASIHRGEEPPITGTGGSGTIFFTGCTLHCGFCQNWQISREGMGRVVSVSEFADICLDLASRKAENINLVTGTQFIPSIAAGLEEARSRGLSIPVLWNSSGYDKAESLSLLSSLVDVWLPDLKTLDSGLAKRRFHAADYPVLAQKSILSMAGRHPVSIVDGVMKSGLMVRHLVLPGLLANTREVLEWFADHLAGRALISVMMQYTPISEAEARNAETAGSIGTPEAPGAAVACVEGEEPGRFLTAEEYEAVLAMMDEFGIEDGYYQELEPDDEWLPDFRKPNPFPSSLSTPVWHWKTGKVG